MRFIGIGIVSLLASLVSSLSIPGLPSCAGDCLPANLGGCSKVDVKCICTNKPLISGLACCVSKQCSKADQKEVIQFAQRICQGQASVTNLPTTATCASSASSSSSGAAASSPTGNAASLNAIAACPGMPFVLAGLMAAL